MEFTLEGQKGVAVAQPGPMGPRESPPLVIAALNLKVCHGVLCTCFCYPAQCYYVLHDFVDCSEPQ